LFLLLRIIFNYLFRQRTVLYEKNQYKINKYWSLTSLKGGLLMSTNKQWVGNRWTYFSSWNIMLQANIKTNFWMRSCWLWFVSWYLGNRFLLIYNWIKMIWRFNYSLLLINEKLVSWCWMRMRNSKLFKCQTIERIGSNTVW
jgi:hypothetical protein